MTDLRHPASRRRFLFGSAAAIATATLLGGCDRLANKAWFRQALNKDDDANKFVQRLLLSDQKLAPEYSQAEISAHFKPNGTSDPSDKDYKKLVRENFASYRLAVDGLVERPSSFSVPELRTMAARSQITRHDCVEGWSCIGQWGGVPLSAVLDHVGLKPQARYVVFFCADSMDDGVGGLSGLESSDTDDADDAGQSGGADAKAAKTTDSKVAEGSQAQTPAPSGKAATAKSPNDPGNRYYESIDLIDAFHPQTILAYDMNGKPLPVAHGAPLRLRVERQLGYKSAKYVMRIAVVDDLKGIGQGNGGYWEDNGYEWYAGI